MPIEPIVCSQCGAPLAVPAGVNFVTCNHCQAQLAVRREASVTYTEAVEKLAKTTEQLSRQVAGLQRAAELERLDREWQIEREGMMVSGKHGKHLPTATGGVLMIVFGIVGGGFMFLMFAGFVGSMISAGAPGPLMLFTLAPLLMGAFAIAAGVLAIRKAQHYDEAHANYRRRREELEGEVVER